MNETTKNPLTRLGFKFDKGGAHSSRTLMLEDMQMLLAKVNQPEALKDDYQYAIMEDNCLVKRTVKTRMLTFRHLVDLYSLDNSVILYRTLLFFWRRDPEGQSLLALLCAYSRDSILRSSAAFILKFNEGERISRDSLEELIDNIEPGRFSKATLRSTAQNINSTFTKSGHLHGRNIKIRNRAKPTAGSVSYALFLGYLTGIRGESLFRTEYMQLLDSTFERAIELAEEASRKGWLVFKRVGNIMEVLFPNLLNQKEKELLFEQS